MVGLLISTRAQAVILLGTGDPTAHTTPPTGALADSGWKTQTDAGPCATAVGPRHLLTAAHMGILPGFALHFGGLVYPVVQIARASDSDLLLVEIAGRLDADRIARLTIRTNEVGNGVVIHGRGGPRGAAVTVEGLGGSELRGWRWTGMGSPLRWGTNVIEDVAVEGGTNPGSFLRAWFDPDGGDHEATVSIGDSGGGVFLREDDGWSLAGVMNAVQSEFRRTADGETFVAAIFDRRDLFEWDSENGWQVDPAATLQPGTLWQATRVSSYAEWVTGEMVKPPVVDWPRLLSAATPDGPFAEHTAYALDIPQRRISVLISDEQRYFRFDGAGKVQAQVLGKGSLSLQYRVE
ncbi:MAG: hypothetical protein RIS76_485 [Verrucomicrobiota bacterium]